MTARAAGWRPGQLTPFISIDFREFDPSSGIPRQAYKRWLKRIDAGKLRCLGCWHPLKFESIHQPLLLGVMRLPGSVSLMAMCFSCVGGHDVDRAGDILLEAAIGHHGADRVLVHEIAR